MVLTPESLNAEILKAEAAIKTCEEGIFFNSLIVEGSKEALKKCTSTS